MNNEEVTIKIGESVYMLVDFEENVDCEDCDIRQDFNAKGCEICFTLNMFERNAIFQRQEK